MNQRTAAILAALLAGDEFQTIASLAEQLDVSGKTISREIATVEAVLVPYGLTLQKKKGQGIRLVGSAAQRKTLCEALAGKGQRDYTPEERRSIIVSRLLPESEPVKLFALAQTLHVTDGTISNDLGKLEGWFRRHGLTLVRKPGLGVYVEGGEQAIRQAIVEYIYDHIEEGELLELVHESLAPHTEKKSGEAADRASRYLLDLVDKEIIYRLERLIRKAEQRLEHQLSEQAFAGLIVHLALAVQRIRKQEKIEMSPEYLKSLKEKREYAAAARIGADIAKEFDIPVGDGEIGYITMHLLGARNRYKSVTVTDAGMDNFHLVRIAKSIMKAAERQTGYPLDRNPDLLTGLVNHLGPSIRRLQMKMEIRNPLQSDMEARFPELMELAKIAVRGTEKELDLHFPPSEIAYIAMHLSAAVSDCLMKRQRSMTLRTVVSCPTGMGTSRLLASRLREHYENLQIVDTISTLELTPDYLDAKAPDLVVSTVPVAAAKTFAMPVIVVSALLGTDDMRRIDEELTKLSEQAVERAARPKADFPDAPRSLDAYAQAILALLDGFFSVEARSAMTIGQVAAVVGSIAARDDNARAKAIANALLAREELGSTAITGSGMILLHTRSDVVQRLQFGIVHLGSAFSYENQPDERIRTALVMLAPKTCSREALETIGHISSILMERWGLIEALHEGNPDDIHAELTHIFREFYQKQTHILLGD